MTRQGDKPASTPCSAAKLLARGRPVQSAIAMAESLTALPVIGSRLGPLVTVTAIGAWASRMAPRMVTELRQQPEPTSADEPPADGPPAPVPVLAEICNASLKGIIGDLDGVSWPLPQRWAPALRMLEQRRRYVH